MKESDFFVLEFSTIFDRHQTAMFLQPGYQLQMVSNSNIQISA